MEKFIKHTGIAAVLDRANIDTDQIIPKQFLKKIERTGFGVHLFHDWRFLDDAGTKPNLEFELNHTNFEGASILVTGANFGCGSSREHAPWALQDYGFQVILAPSFADIFFNNCFKNGMLPIVLHNDTIKEIMQWVVQNPGSKISVDLNNRSLHAAGKEIKFEVDDFRRECLLNGWDDIGLSLRHIRTIDTFEKAYHAKHAYMLIG